MSKAENGYRNAEWERKRVKKKRKASRARQRLRAKAHPQEVWCNSSKNIIF